MLRLVGVQGGPWPLSARPKDSVHQQLCPGAPASSEDGPPKLAYKSQFLLFQHVFVHFWSSLSEGQDLGFCHCGGVLQCSCHRGSALQVPEEKDGVCKARCIPTLLSPSPTLSTCTALLLEGELENSSANGNHLLREIHIAEEP